MSAMVDLPASPSAERGVMNRVETPRERLPNKIMNYVTHLEKDLRLQRELVTQSQQTLARIYASHGWKVLQNYYHVRNQLFPVSSRRRRLARAVLRMAQKLYSLVRWKPRFDLYNLRNRLFPVLSRGDDSPRPCSGQRRDFAAPRA